MRGINQRYFGKRKVITGEWIIGTEVRISIFFAQTMTNTPNQESTNAYAGGGDLPDDVYRVIYGTEKPPKSGIENGL